MLIKRFLDLYVSRIIIKCEKNKIEILQMMKVPVSDSVFFFFSPFKETYINNKETYFIQLYVKLSIEIN